MDLLFKKLTTKGNIKNKINHLVAAGWTKGTTISASRNTRFAFTKNGRLIIFSVRNHIGTSAILRVHA